MIFLQKAGARKRGFVGSMQFTKASRSTPNVAGTAMPRVPERSFMRESCRPAISVRFTLGALRRTTGKHIETIWYFKTLNKIFYGGIYLWHG